MHQSSIVIGYLRYGHLSHLSMRSISCNSAQSPLFAVPKVHCDFWGPRNGTLSEDILPFQPTIPVTSCKTTLSDLFSKERNIMKSPPQPATVHELNEDGSPMLHSKVSATKNRVTKRNATPYSLNRAQHRPRKAPECIVGKSMRSGSLHDMVKNPGQNSAVPMIIFSRHQDTDSERNEVPGCRFRKVSFLGTYMIVFRLQP